MAEFSVFDKLVTRLSSSERRTMLERIAASIEIPATEVPESGSDTTVDLEAAYKEMGLLRRLIVTVIAFFTGRDRLGVVEAQLLGELRRRTAAASSDYDSARDQLRQSAHASFQTLANAARHFAARLSRVMGRERAGFIAFLAGLHAPDLQQRLLVDADPFAIAEQFPDMKDTEIKRRTMLTMEETLVTLPPETRNKIYHDVRSLHHLMSLSSFAFERLLAEFTPVAGGEAVPVPINRLASELGKLAGILNGLYPGPSPVSFEALSIHHEQDRLEEPDEAVEGLLKTDVDADNEAYSQIVAFARKYPVTDMVRLAHGNIHWRPVPLPGGEDWFAVWKSFWQERVEKVYRRFSYRRRVDVLIEEARETVGITEAREFPGYPASGLDDHAKHGLSLGLVRSIFGDLYLNELQAPLAMIYRDGEFYKGDNRTEYDEAMREIEKIRTDVANLEVRLQPTGDLGTLWKQTTDGTLAPEAASERQEILATQIDADASGLVRRTINAFKSIGDILEGILYGTVGGRYDTLSNLAQLGGTDSKQTTRKLETVHIRSKAISNLLSDVINLESLQRG